MSRWWRAYDEAVDDPKLCLLSDRQHRAWFNLCCITSQNGGVLPSIDAIAFKLRMTPAKAQALIVELRAAGLIDEAGGDLAPHNWRGRQFQSDGSTERVKRFREQQRNVSLAVAETAPDTDTETDSEQKERVGAVAPATRPDVAGEFEKFWTEYPHRGTAANPSKPAFEKFGRLLKAGVDPAAIIAGARRFCEIERAAGRYGTDKVAQAITWLNQERFNDYGEPAAAPAAVGGYYAKAESEQLHAWDAHAKSERGRSLPRDRDGGWWVEQEWPPGYVPGAQLSVVA